MTKQIFILLSFVFFYNYSLAQKKAGYIQIQIVGNVKNLPDSLPLIYQPVEQFVTNRKALLSSKNRLFWKFTASKPVSINFDRLFSRNVPPALITWYILEPGDDVTIRITDHGLLFSGKGAEKLRLRNQLEISGNIVKKPVGPLSFFSKSAADYLEWHRYLQEKYEAARPVLEMYKDSVADLTLTYLKIGFIKSLESARHDKFSSLVSQFYNDSTSGLTIENLCHIYDSTFFTPETVWMRKQPFGNVASTSFLSDQINRSYKFSSPFTGPDGSLKYLSACYEQSKKEYTGRALENCLVAILKKVFEEIKYNPDMHVILAKYYSEPRMDEYKQLVMQYELDMGKLTTGQMAPTFSLPDESDVIYRLRDFRGKVMLLNFIKPDCNPCFDAVKALARLSSPIKYDSTFVVINIMVSAKGKTDLSIKSNHENSKRNMLFLLTETDNPIIKAYGVSQLPASYLINDKGKMITSSALNPILQKQELINLIEKELEFVKNSLWINTHDGPYVLKEMGLLKSWSIAETQVTEVIHDEKKSSILRSSTDKPKQFFTIQLKDSLTIEPSEYEAPKKLLAFSDIEGNFDALRALLQANKVIDNEFNWIFGSGHLVIAGDLVDRGNQVTECLWLIYSLEDKAKAAGGYVHFVLGNHEIMNLSGDLRYVNAKYKKNSTLMRKDYARELYGTNSELGRWIRTKNIAEKIGDVLFVHAGISEKVNRLSLPLFSMNEIARKYFDDEVKARASTDSVLAILFNPEFSPFWYRNYYFKRDVNVKVINNSVDTLFKTPMEEIDATLNMYGVDHIVTGHTIFKGNNMKGENISMHYSGKVFNIDTNHHKDWSEGLLIEGDKFYRVNAEGKRVLLFVDDKRKKTN